MKTLMLFARTGLLCCVLVVALAALTGCSATKTTTATAAATTAATTDNTLDATIEIIRRIPAVPSPATPSVPSIPSPATPSVPAILSHPSILSRTSTAQGGFAGLSPTILDTTTYHITTAATSTTTATAISATTNTATTSRQPKVGEGVEKVFTTVIERIFFVIIALFVIFFAAFCRHLYHKLQS